VVKSFVSRSQTRVHSMVNFTVAIPTYNGEFRLPEVLEKLRSQIYPETLSWEVLVVDNNSRDNTARVVREYQKDFPVPLRYSLELKQGAAFARKRAIQEAQSDLLGFLDDDNIPTETWVAAAYAFARSRPQVGAFGSQIHGEYEVEIPPGFDCLLPFLAITERGDLPLRYEPQKKLLPPSAGLVMRKQAWLECVPQHAILGGRTEASMLTGEDLEMLSHIQQSAQWEVWYNPAMEITHKIPRHRLERAYLLSFFQGIGYSRFITRMLSVKQWQRPLVALVYAVNDLRRIALHFLKHHAHLKTDLVAACQMQLFVSSFLSPFYLWKNGYFSRRKQDAIAPRPIESLSSQRP
jgi:glycosyltransferase involved in cell wall biosynthesis